MNQGSLLAASRFLYRFQNLTLTAKSSRGRFEEQEISTHAIIHPSNITTPAPQPGYLDTYQPITNDTAVYAAASFIVMSMSEPPMAPLISLSVPAHHQHQHPREDEAKKKTGKTHRPLPVGPFAT